jgi:hypothetical protein
VRSAPSAQAPSRLAGTAARSAAPLRGTGGPALRLALSLGAVLVLALCLAPASALAATAHEYDRSFGPDCTDATEFGEGAASLAVDQVSHDVYALNALAGTLTRCAANGTPDSFTAGPGTGTNVISGFSNLSLEGLNQVAIDQQSHDFFVTDFGAEAIKAFKQNGEEAEFSAGAGAGSNEIPLPGSYLGGVAIDTEGNIYAGDAIAGEVKIFKPSGEALTSFATLEPANLAVDSAGAVYVAPYHFSVPGVIRFIPSQFPLTPSTTYEPDPSLGGGSGIVDAAPKCEGAICQAFAVSVDPVTDDVYIVEHFDFEHSQVAQFSPEGNLLSTFAGPGEEGELEFSEGVAIDGETGVVYASDAWGAHRVEVFTPPPPVPPTIESSSIANTTTTSTYLRARVNPNLFSTHYHFEYLTEADYMANGETFVGASQTGETALGSSGEGQLAVAYVGALSPDTTYRFRVVAENEGGQGLSAEPAPRFTTYSAVSSGLPDSRAYELVSPSAKAGQVIPPENGGAGEGPGGTCDHCLPAGRIMPMQARPDGEAIVYVGQPFSLGSTSGSNEYLGSRSSTGWRTENLSEPRFATFTDGQGYQAVSSDLTRSILFQVTPPLTADAPSRAGKGFANLYLRESDGALEPAVTVEPPERDPGTGANGFSVILGGANAGTASVPAFENFVFEANDSLTAEVPEIAPAAPAVSASGSNVYQWHAGSLSLVNVLPGNTGAVPNAVIGSGALVGSGRAVDHAVSADGSRIFWSDATSGQLYVRIGGTETVEVEDHVGEFLTASPDGDRVLLSDGCLYIVETESCTDLTLDQASAHKGGFVGLLGAGDNLSRIYFVDSEVLTPGEKNASGEEAEPAKKNLYFWSEGAITFIGRLVDGDQKVSGSGTFGTWKASRSTRTAQVTPNGRYLAFMSKAPLKEGYDNEAPGCRVQNSEPEITPCFEVYEYDADRDLLHCASCSPTGQKPLGRSNLSALSPFPLSPPFPQPRNLSPDGSGRLFFESQDSLSIHDNNGKIQDVYEWTPPGVGGCSRTDGCLGLISSGSDPGDSMFVDSTPSGDDVFFITRQQLVPQDQGQQLDLYDARAPHLPGELVGVPLSSGPQPCSGEACRPPPSPAPLSQGAGSAAFAGPENPKCPKGKLRRKGRCVKRHPNTRSSHRRAGRHGRGGAK